MAAIFVIYYPAPSSPALAARALPILMFNHKPGIIKSYRDGIEVYYGLCNFLLLRP